MLGPSSWHVVWSCLFVHVARILTVVRTQPRDTIRGCQILQTSLHDARAFADRLDSFAEQGITAAVTSDEAYARDAAAQLVMPEVQKLL
mgnify:CR=1 FL=1